MTARPWRWEGHRSVSAENKEEKERKRGNKNKSSEVKKKKDTPRGIDFKVEINRRGNRHMSLLGQFHRGGGGLRK